MTTDTAGRLEFSDILLACPYAQDTAGIGGNVREELVGVFVLNPAQGFGTGSGGRSLPAHALAGKGAMPPKGGSSASDAEIKAVVAYMVNASK